MAIGRAIVRGPSVFLFDEPLSNLDAELRVEMRVEIARLHAELGATMIYVTHDQVEAMTLADKIVVLRGGNVEQVGSPMELYRNPNNRFVAGFIGSPGMNFLNGVTKDGGVQVPALEGCSISAEMNLPADGDGVTVGLRPQVLGIEPNRSSQLKIELSEQLGGVTYDYLKTPTDERIVVESRGDANLPSGTPVELVFDQSQAMFFDSKSGQRIR